MRKTRWRLVPFLAFTLAACVDPAAARAGSVHDEAGLFSKEAVAKADVEIGKIERDLKVDVVVETILTLDGEDIHDEARRLAEKSGVAGIFVLIAKKEKKLRVVVHPEYRHTLDRAEVTIRRAFTKPLETRDFDGGLLQGLAAIDKEATAAKAEFGSLRQGGQPGVRVNNGAPVRGMPRRRAGGGVSGLGSLLMIGLGIMAVLFVIRTIGALFGGGRQGYGAQGPMMGRPGYGGGYGGGGGGFMSGLFGGIGGAIAGNWLYDQFSGRHGGSYGGDGGYDAGNTGEAPTSEGWGDSSGSTGDWSGGGDTGGGSAGGDWGGGGGDWGGGGGGDWGGGGGGGDW